MKNLSPTPACARRRFAALLAYLIFALNPSGVPAQAVQRDASRPPHIAYSVSIADLDAHRFRVAIAVENAPVERLTFAIPAWTPGYYQILSYEQNIRDVHAQDEAGRSLTVTHPSERQWEVAAGDAACVTLTYDVLAEDADHGFFGSVLNGKDKEGYINGASALMYVAGQTQTPVTLAVSLPRDWKLASPLQPWEGESPTTQLPNNSITQRPTPNTQHPFIAKSYDELIDSPMQLGHFDSLDFTVSGVAFHAILVGKRDAVKGKFAPPLAKIVRAGMDVFHVAATPENERAFRQYTFFYHFGGGGFTGGLEHRNSTVIHLGSQTDPAGDGFITVSAHEFFHAWNVKRLRPEVLGPFDYTRPARTASLWFAEGVTDYYALLLPYRAGLRDRNWLLQNLADRIGELDDTPARRRISLEEASRKAWEGHSEGFDGLSYYLKGSLIGFYFDLRIRELTEGRKNLDDVLRYLEARYGRKDTGYPEDALRIALNIVAEADLTSDYRRYVGGTEEIAWEPVLERLGLSLKRDASAFLGIRLGMETASAQDTPKFVLVQSVEEGLAGHKMGLQAGDHILQINDKPVGPDTLIPTLQKTPANSPITIQVERSGQLLLLKGVSGLHYTNHNLLFLPETRLTEATRRLRNSFLGIEPPVPSK